MERTIKFKAKRLDNSEWVIGDLLHSYENGAIIVLIEGSGAFSVDPSTVCQCTGIYDEDGDEIFENDLVQVVQTKVVFAVVWNPIYACYSFLNEKENRYAATNFAEFPSKDMLIVGNRFDRKEGEK